MLRLLIFIVLLWTNFVKAETIYSAANGNWQDKLTWSFTKGGAACDCVPGNGDDVVILENYSIIINTDLIIGPGNVISLTIQNDAALNMSGKNISVLNGGSLFVFGKIINSQNVEFNRGSFVNTDIGSAWEVKGDLTNTKNSTTITINGTITVTGNVTADSASSINGAGGTISAKGSIKTLANAAIFGSDADCTDAITHCLATPSYGIGYLQIELIKFEAVKEMNKVYLSWSTASEINNDYFEIERSSDGRDFYPIQKVKGTGNSSKTSRYYEFDTDPLHGVSYYRLKEVATDGKSKHYPSVKIEFDAIGGKTPSAISNLNPVDDETNTKTSLGDFGLESDVLVVLRDANGNDFYTKVVLISVEGDTCTAFDMGKHIAPGTYTIISTSSNHILEHKMVIKE